MARLGALAFALALALWAGSALAQAPTNATFRQGHGPNGTHGGPAPQLAMVAMVATLAFLPLNLWRRLVFPRLAAAGKAGLAEAKQAAQWIRRTGLNGHMVLGALTLVGGTIHGLTESRSNGLLWAGMGGIAALFVLGTLLHWRWWPWLARQRGALLVVKWGLTALSLAVLLVGHSMAHPTGPLRSVQAAGGG